MRGEEVVCVGVVGVVGVGRGWTCGGGRSANSQQSTEETILFLHTD